jgi:hypothetical protein
MALAELEEMVVALPFILLLMEILLEEEEEREVMKLEIVV